MLTWPSAQIPALGFGTWQDKDAQEPAVMHALKAGYRHIDTAAIYGTEPGVGNAIKKSGVPRDQIFITTKLWNHQHHPDDVAPALEDSLKALQVDYVDLWLMHWPNAFARGPKKFPKGEHGRVKPGDTDFVATWKAMEKCFHSGKAKAIGVSNFSKAELEKLLAEAEVVPAVHQLELHPYLQQKEFCEWHDSKGIHVTQYSPFGNQNEIYDAGKNVPKLITNEVLVDVGKKHNMSGAQVALAWGIAHGRSVIPKSKTESRIRDNFAGQFDLSAEEVKKIDGIDRKLRFNDPSQQYGWNLYADLDGKLDENKL